jgi:DNA polymerase III sliding clamp (beta) subunit (PCNA family)
MITRQLAGPYISDASLRGVLSKEPPDRCGIEPEELARAVKLAQLASDGSEFSHVDLRFAPGEVTVTSGADERGFAEQVPVSGVISEVTFSLGIRYLLDGLAGCADDTTEIGFTAPPAPLFLRSGSFRYMIQPRREI